MKKIRHILRAKEFADIFESGRKIQGKEIALYFKRGSAPKGVSVGIVISRKVVPLAVRRNYIRRIIYSYFREHNSAWREGTKVIVRLVRDAGQKKKSLSLEIREALELLTEKAGIKK